MRVFAAISVVVLAGLVPSASKGQEAGERFKYAWRPLLEHQGVDFRYIFYKQADSQNDGVVILLINTNDHAVDYSFRVVFRSENSEAESEVAGRLEAGQAKTGDEDGLFWIPFDDARPITELGLRAYRVTAVSVKRPGPHGTPCGWPFHVF